MGQLVLMRGRGCEKSGDEVVGGDPFALGGEIDDQAVTQHRLGQGLNVFDRHVGPTLDQGPCLGANNQELHGPRAGAPGQLLADEFRRRRLRERAFDARARACSESNDR